jgi:hypothetical protein
MRARRPYILFARLVVALLIATTSVGAWAGPAWGETAACSACADAADVALPNPEAGAAACCTDHGPAGADGSGPAAPDEIPADDCCPDDCGRCCRTPARVPVLSPEADAVIPPTTIITLPSTPPTLPPPAGVHRSIFHPPRH